MFDVVEGFEFGKGSKRTRKSRYDWDMLLDGKVRKVTQEDLGDTQVKSFLALLYGKVKDRGVKVRTAKQADGSLIIQAILQVKEQAKEGTPTTPSIPPAPVAVHEQESSEASNGEEFEVEEGETDESEEAAEEVEIPTPARTAHSARKATSRGVR